MPTAYIQPFDFRKIFVQYFLGSAELFFFAFIIIFSYTAAKFRMSNKIYLTLLSLGCIIFAGVIGPAVYALALLIISLMVFYIISKY